MSRTPKGFKNGEKHWTCTNKKVRKDMNICICYRIISGTNIYTKVICVYCIFKVFLALPPQINWHKGATSAFTFGSMFIMAEYVCITLISFEAHGVVTLPHTWHNQSCSWRLKVSERKHKVKSNYCQICWLLKTIQPEQPLRKRKKNLRQNYKNPIMALPVYIFL